LSFEFLILNFQFSIPNSGFPTAWRRDDPSLEDVTTPLVEHLDQVTEYKLKNPAPRKPGSAKRPGFRGWVGGGRGRGTKAERRKPFNINEIRHSTKDNQTCFDGPPAREAREGVDRGSDESLLSEGTRDTTEAAERSDAAAGVRPFNPRCAGETPAPQKREFLTAQARARIE
jgi:hypothetical protein